MSEPLIVTEPIYCVSTGCTLHGTLTRPLAGKPVPAALLFHGFLVDSTEMDGIWLRLSRHLAKSGIASAVFDFAGIGRSEGNYNDISLRTQVADAEAILSCISSLDCVDGAHICAAGMSMGGAVATLLAGKHPDEISSLCLWAPGACIPDHMRRSRRVRSFGPESRFVRDVLEMDFFREADGFEGDVLILSGSEDFMLRFDGNDYVARYRDVYGSRMSFVEIEGAEHGYWGHHADEVLTHTVRFMTDTLL